MTTKIGGFPGFEVYSFSKMSEEKYEDVERTNKKIRKKLNKAYEAKTDAFVPICKCNVNYAASLCSGCRRIKYCSRACQKDDWPRHKVECQYWQKQNKEDGGFVAKVCDDLRTYVYANIRTYLKRKREFGKPCYFKLAAKNVDKTKPVVFDLELVENKNSEPQPEKTGAEYVDVTTDLVTGYSWMSRIYFI